MTDPHDVRRRPGTGLTPTASSVVSIIEPRVVMRIAVVAMSLALVGVAASETSPLDVRYADGRVTAHLESADLTAVIVEVARQAGLEVRGTPTDPKPCTIDLDGVPLADALSRLLAGQSFTLTYTTAGLKGVRFVGSTNATLVAASPPISSDPADLLEVPPSAAQQASERPVAIGGRLARAIGSDRANFSDVIDVAMRNADPRVRADALRIGFRILDSEPELQASVLYVLDHWGNDQLAGWLTTVAGDYAGDVAHRAATRARWTPLRRRAEAVERVIQSGGVAKAGG
jgi:hypothetical protein